MRPYCATYLIDMSLIFSSVYGRNDYQAAAQSQLPWEFEALNMEGTIIKQTQTQLPSTLKSYIWQERLPSKDSVVASLKLSDFI
jgi:hypothetical protein